MGIFLFTVIERFTALSYPNNILCPYILRLSDAHLVRMLCGSYLGHPAKTHVRILVHEPYWSNRISINKTRCLFTLLTWYGRPNDQKSITERCIISHTQPNYWKGEPCSQMYDFWVKLSCLSMKFIDGNGNSRTIRNDVHVSYSILKDDQISLITCDLSANIPPCYSRLAVQ